ncbi:MAG TPA: hypothetical protein PLJ58_01340 [bacterium]|jgi:hypothetical protein|nr:hypothetical protein [bacterium]
MTDNNMCCKSSCACMHHKMVPMLITLLGINFLLVTMGVYDEMVSAYVWPILLTLIGLQKMMGGCCKCCSK